jgi:hypothetical protein
MLVMTNNNPRAKIVETRGQLLLVKREKGSLKELCPFFHFDDDVPRTSEIN